MTGAPSRDAPGAATGERLHVGLIGFGAIGRDLFARLAPQFRLSVLTRSAGHEVPAGSPHHQSVEALIAGRPALVVEAAGQDAAADLAPRLLAEGIDVVLGSTGILGDAALVERLISAARSGHARLIVPSGAVGGLDYLTAVAPCPGTTVAYVSRKPVAAWTAELRAAGIDPANLAAAHVLFEGSAAEAAALYPRNLNAGLTVALAAAPAPTTVRVIADPAVHQNMHEIHVDGPAGTALMRFANLPSPDNPKTSALTALSLAATVRRHVATLII